MSFSVSKSAARKILDSADRGSFFRVRVDPGGCFGFQYAFSFEKAKESEDLVFENEGAKVLVDKASLPFLKEATLDYQEEMIGSHFVVENPAVQSSCGCKNSFAPPA